MVWQLDCFTIYVAVLVANSTFFLVSIEFCANDYQDKNRCAKRYIEDPKPYVTLSFPMAPMPTGSRWIALAKKQGENTSRDLDMQSNYLITSDTLKTAVTMLSGTSHRSPIQELPMTRTLQLQLFSTR